MDHKDTKSNATRGNKITPKILVATNKPLRLSEEQRQRRQKSLDELTRLSEELPGGYE